MQEATQERSVARGVEPHEREGLAGLRATIDLAAIGIGHFEPGGRFLLANDCLCRMVGYSREELMALTYQAITYAEDLPACVQNNRRLLEGAIDSYRQDKRFVRADGALVWARVTVSAVRDLRGAISFFIGTAEDITESVGARHALERSESRFRTLANLLPQMLWIANEQGERSWYNDRWLHYTGLTHDEVAGRGWEQVVHPSLRERVIARQRACFAEGAVWEDTVLLRGADGQHRWFLSRAVPIPAEPGEPRLWIGSNTDVTEAKNAEAERERLLALEREARAASERAMRARDEMVALVAHDLRNPAHTIRMAVSLLQQPTVREEQRASLLRTLARTVAGMERLLNDLLDVSRMDAGTFAVEVAPLEVQRVLDTVCEHFESKARERALSLACHAAPGLPALRADHDRLVQVLSNLVGNAIKFSRPPGEIRVVVRADESEAHFTVQDNGPGIAREHLPRLFDRYWQQRPGAGGGAGLGLPIAKGIVEAHGGRIWAESDGNGSAFHFTVPLAR